MKKNKAFFSTGGEKVYKAVIYVALIILAICIIIPVAWAFVASIKRCV